MVKESKFYDLLGVSPTYNNVDATLTFFRFLRMQLSHSSSPRTRKAP